MDIWLVHRSGTLSKNDCFNAMYFSKMIIGIYVYFDPTDPYIIKSGILKSSVGNDPVAVYLGVGEVCNLDHMPENMSSLMEELADLCLDSHKTKFATFHVKHHTKYKFQSVMTPRMLLECEESSSWKAMHVSGDDLGTNYVGAPSISSNIVSGTAELGKAVVDPNSSGNSGNDDTSLPTVLAGTSAADALASVKRMSVDDYLAPNSEYCISESDVKISFFENKTYDDYFLEDDKDDDADDVMGNLFVGMQALDSFVK